MARRPTQKTTATVKTEAKTTTAVASGTVATATTDKVVNLAVSKLLPEVQQTFADIADAKGKDAAANQHLARLVCQHHEAMVATGSNSNPVASWRNMVGNDRKLTDAGTKYIAQVIADFITKVSAPSKSDISQVSQDAYKASRARETALRNACKLAIAHGFMGGTSSDWDAKRSLLSVKVSVIRPVQAASTLKQRVWAFWYGVSNDDNQLLDGSSWRMSRKDEADQEKSITGEWSVAAVLRAFYAVPAHLAVQSQTTSDAPQGADNNRVEEYDAKTRNGVLSHTVLSTLLVYAGKALDDDKTAKVGADYFNGNPTAFDALRKMAMLYASVAEEMRTKTMAAAAKTQPKTNVA